MKKIFIFLLYCSFSYCFSQVGIGTDTPKATLDIQAIKTDGSTPEGVIPPRLTADQLALGDAQYDTPQNGAIVYITTPFSSGGGSPKTSRVVNVGYYYYDADQQLWMSIGGGAAEPWYSVTTSTGATLNTEDIYQLGQNGIGVSSPDVNAQLDVSSPNKGMLIPRVSMDTRNTTLANVTDGLMIFNTDTNCINYYNAGTSTWLSLCGTYDPATLSIVCGDPNNGPSGTFTQGTSINGINTYTVVVNAATAGSYVITVTTTNGYSFTKSGTFTAPGKYTVVLDGQGTPANGGSTYTDSVTLTMNGIKVTDCTLPTISVGGSTTAVTFTCPSGVTVNGTYLKGIVLDGSTNYIDIAINSVVNPGNLIVETDFQNGMKFSSGSVAITAATTSIRLYGQGTPTATATPGTTFTFSINSDSGGGVLVPCTFQIPVGSSLGTFENPADRCLSILNDNPAATDGEYWIKGDGNAATKTYCDMTNGGYTLIWSYSEKTAYNNGTYNRYYLNTSLSTYGASLALTRNNPQQVVTAKTGTILYNNYRLSNSTMKQLRTSTTPDYRIRITEEVTNMNNAWAGLNYLHIKITNSSYDLTVASAEYSQGAQMNIDGKILGATFTRNGCTKIFNGTTITTGCGSDPAFYTNQGSYPNHINWSGTSSAPAFTPITPSGNGDNSVSIPGSANLFGLFRAGGEPSLNHLFGKCTSDDNSFSTPTCVNTTPHSVNGGEGRYLQWFVK